jgi:hypothetical protein
MVKMPKFGFKVKIMLQAYKYSYGIKVISILLLR